MDKQIRKYNPGFLTDQELVDSFCVRTAEFGLIVEALRESTGNSNSHQIVIGPRGSGKTTLLLRVAAELRRDAGLRSSWFPVIFPEESYEISTCGEFWLQCLHHLANQGPQEERTVDLRRTFEEFRTIQDDRTLADRCLAAILDVADSLGKRLVVIVENLNMIFADIGDVEVGWQLRKTLQDEPRIILLGSATARFEEIDNASRALYDLFQVHTLRRLTPESCAKLWRFVSGKDIDARVVRSLQILTGGNPRLLAIVAQFGAQLSFGDLMKDLLNLVDDHTEYFRSHLESLPPQERRIYVALAILWKPASARQVSVRARIPTSQCSALLGRLVRRGAVLRSGGTRHRREYYLAERMYNIYYLLRAGRGTDRVVEALVRFMAAYYSPSELARIRERILEEATGADPNMRVMMRSALDRIAAMTALDGVRNEPEHSLGTASEVGELVERARILLREAQYDQAIEVCGDVEDQLKKDRSPGSDQHSASALVVKSTALGRLDHLDAAIIVCDEILERFSASTSAGIGKAVATAQAKKVALLARLDRANDVLAACGAFLDRFESDNSPATDQQRSEVIYTKGVAFIDLGQAQKADAAFDEVISRFGLIDSIEVQENVVRASRAKAGLMEQQLRKKEALAAYGALASKFASSHAPGIVAVVATALLRRGAILRDIGRYDEALTTFADVANRLEHFESPEILELAAMAQLNGATMLDVTGEPQRARRAYDAVVDRFASHDSPVIAEAVVTALVNHGNSLARVSRSEEALVVYDRALESYARNGAPAVLEMARRALIGRAASELSLGRTDRVIATVGEVLERTDSDHSNLVLNSLLLRAEAYFDGGNRTACKSDLARILELLPTFPSVPNLGIDALISFAARLGSRPILEMIQESRSEQTLLPLVTALREELGIDSKVAVEVQEVARDIRKDLAMLRQDGHAND